MLLGNRDERKVRSTAADIDDEDEVSQLDALGELQLEAGLYQDACATIKQIMTLQPTDMEQYRNLLTQLGC